MNDSSIQSLSPKGRCLFIYTVCWLAWVWWCVSLLSGNPCPPHALAQEWASLYPLFTAAIGFWQPIFSAFRLGIVAFLHQTGPTWGGGMGQNFTFQAYACQVGKGRLVVLLEKRGLCVFWMQMCYSLLCKGSWQLLGITCSSVLWRQVSRSCSEGESVSCKTVSPWNWLLGRGKMFRTESRTSTELLPM